MEIKDYVKQYRDLQKSHKKVRLANFCRENMLDYYEMVEALKQEKFEMESYEEQVQCGDLVITEIPESNAPSQVVPPSESYIKEVMLSFPVNRKTADSGCRPTLKIQSFRKGTTGSLACLIR